MALFTTQLTTFGGNWDILVWTFQLCQQTWKQFVFYVFTPVCLFVCQQDV